MINSFSGEVNYKIKIQKSVLLDVNIRGENLIHNNLKMFLLARKKEVKNLVIKV